MESAEYTVLGGGWASLLRGYELAIKFPNSKIDILEKSGVGNLGGLLHSEIINGFTFDTGGPHILFSKNQKILDKIVNFLDGNVRKLERNAFVHFREAYVPYPFENGMYVLDRESRAKIGTDIIAAMLHNATHPDWSPVTFRDWIYGFFGDSMGSEYLEPYNKKIWKTDPSDMDASWVFSPGRLPFPALRDIISSIAGIRSVGYKEQQYFYYPKSGGIQALYDAVYVTARKLGIEFISNFQVTNVKKEPNGWLINNKLHSKYLINTLPLTLLPKIFRMPNEIKNLINNLHYTKDIVVGVALNKRSPAEHVLYVPSSNVRFHRLTWISNLAGTPNENYSNLIAETTVREGSVPNVEEITRDTLSGLRNLNIINSENDVLFTKAWINDYGYPIYTRVHVKTRQQIFEYLNKAGIPSVGRWGSWHYWNTDKVYEAVIETVGRIKM